MLKIIKKAFESLSRARVSNFPYAGESVGATFPPPETCNISRIFASRRANKRGRNPSPFCARANRRKITLPAVLEFADRWHAVHSAILLPSVSSPENNGDILARHFACRSRSRRALSHCALKSTRKSVDSSDDTTLGRIIVFLHKNLGFAVFAIGFFVGENKAMELCNWVLGNWNERFIQRFYFTRRKELGLFRWRPASTFFCGGVKITCFVLGDILMKILKNKMIYWIWDY